MLTQHTYDTLIVVANPYTKNYFQKLQTKQHFQT